MGLPSSSSKDRMSTPAPGDAAAGDAAAGLELAGEDELAAAAATAAAFWARRSRSYWALAVRFLPSVLTLMEKYPGRFI